VAEILGLAGFSIVPALLPQFIEAWSLTNTQAGWLAGITSAGYMLAVIPLVSLTDRRPARHIYLTSAGLSAVSCFGMALCDSLLPALAFRALAGIAMAGMYMPGLRALTYGAEGATRARIAAWYTSSFTIGASLSFLFGRVGTLLGWQSAFVIAGILGAAGVLIAWAALPRGDKNGNPMMWSQCGCDRKILKQWFRSRPCSRKTRLPNSRTPVTRSHKTYSSPPAIISTQLVLPP
jgi:MFS family permease